LLDLAVELERPSQENGPSKAEFMLSGA